MTNTGSENGRKNADFLKDLAVWGNVCSIIQLKFVEALTFVCPLVLQVHRSVIAQKNGVDFSKKIVFFKFF